MKGEREWSKRSREKQAEPQSRQANFKRNIYDQPNSQQRNNGTVVNNTSTIAHCVDLSLFHPSLSYSFVFGKLVPNWLTHSRHPIHSTSLQSNRERHRTAHHTADRSDDTHVHAHTYALCFTPLPPSISFISIICVSVESPFLRFHPTRPEPISADIESAKSQHIITTSPTP